MDPLGARPDTVDADGIQRWGDVETASDPLTAAASVNVLGSELPCAHATPPFPVRADLNNKVAYWIGDVTKLSLEAIVNPTNESLTDKNPISLRILEVAGPELKEDLKTQIGTCRTGDAKLTTAYSLPARHVIHTVGPRYNVKYRTAAESALYNCYRSVMQTLSNRQISTVAIPTLVSCRRNYPAVDGANIALRTVRRFLENYGDDIDLVVFVSPQEDLVYLQLMKLYFPRTAEEEEFSAKALPADIGNTLGEPVILERQIRIADRPIRKSTLVTGSESDEDCTNNVSAPAKEDESDEDGDLVSPEVGHHPFAAMTSNRDHERREVLARQRATMTVEEERSGRYHQYLKMGRSENFADFKALGALYLAGQDYRGRQIVVYIGRLFPASKYDLNKAVSYFVNMMDAVVRRDYVLIYFHTESDPENQPDSTFFKELYMLLDDRYKRNLATLFIVHSNWWFRMSGWWFLTFTGFEVKERVEYLSGVEHLKDFVPIQQLQLPTFIMEYDKKANGTNYYHSSAKPLAAGPEPQGEL